MPLLMDEELDALRVWIESIRRLLLSGFSSKVSTTGWGETTSWSGVGRRGGPGMSTREGRARWSRGLVSIDRASLAMIIVLEGECE